VPPALLGVARAIDPGAHTVEATAPGFVSVRQQLSLQPGQARAMPIYLESATATPPVGVAALAERPQDTPPTPTATRPQAEPARVRPAPTHASGRVAAAPNLLPVYVALGVSAVSLGVGIAFGWAALDDKAELDRNCPGGVCPEAYEARLESAKQRGVVSTAAFGLGAASAALGAVLYFTSGSGPSEARASTSTAPTIRIGLARAELGMTF
jgi:hypothetical protein